MHMVPTMVQPDCLLLWLLELVSWSLSRNKKNHPSMGGMVGGIMKKIIWGALRKGACFFLCDGIQVS